MDMLGMLQLCFKEFERGKRKSLIIYTYNSA